MSLDNLQLFIAVADAKGFSSASNKLDLPVATVSRRIAQLEKEFNVTLFKRNTRNVSLTAAGENFYNQLVPALESVQSAINQLSNAQKSLQGLIRLTSSADFAQHCLSPLLCQFLQHHPDVQMDLKLNTNRMDLITENIDLAIRIGTLEDSNLFAWHLMEMQLKLYATPSYLASLCELLQPQDLSSCNFIGLKTNRHTTTLNLRKLRQEIKIPVQGNLTANDMGTVIALCEANAGVAMLPEILVQNQLKQQSLIEVLPDWHTSATPVHAITPSRNPPALVRQLIEFLKQNLNEG